MGGNRKLGWPDEPMYYLTKYKSTKRPRKCDRCKQNAYYYHPDYHYLCASHLLDLVNIGGLAFSWEEYPEVWARTERLLQREAPSSSGAKSMESPSGTNAVETEQSWDGMRHQQIGLTDE
jgi:hypothetical protein